MMICVKCGSEKPEDAFQMRRALGIRYRACRSCRIAVSNDWRRRNPDKVRASKERSFERASAYQREKWESGYRVPSRLKPRPLSAQGWVLKHPEKVKAQKKLSYSVSKGETPKPSACEVCARSGTRIYGHHQDYGRPLDVNWLCGSCHRRVHVGRLTLKPLVYRH